jgi:small conductance mechanosensitive channel
MTAETETQATENPATIDLPPIDSLNWETIQNYDYSGVTEFLTAATLQILAALAVFVIGKWVVKRLVKLMDRSFKKTKLDRTLADFIENIVYVAGMVLVIVAALGQLGVQTTSFAAAIAAAGLAIGLALQGSLSNFAAGFLIIFFRPFKAGDYVEIAGVGGTVENISIFTTCLVTPDNREITIPNGNITNDTIVNYSAKNKRRIDLVIGVSYQADLQKTQKLLIGILEKHDNVLKDPAPVVEVNELGASSVDFIVRPWVKSDVYWPTRWDLMKTIKIELDKAGIGIPFPQRDIHLFIEDGQLAANANTTKKSKKAA